jgi:ABC-type Fe3+/spermidine/putrescine transport system ATPase subunit
MQTEISTLVRSAGATTICITHDQSEAFALADQVGVLDKGRLVQFGSPEDIYRSPANSFVARFTGLSGEFPVHVEGPAASSGRILVRADLEGAQGGRGQGGRRSAVGGSCRPPRSAQRRDAALP